MDGLRDLTWDGSSVFARFGTTKVPFLKFDVPEEETKVEKIRRLGEQLASVRTPGAHEIPDFAAEILVSDYVEIILPRMPRHGGSLVTFPVTMNHRHPAIIGSYSIIIDAVRVVKIGQTIENGEKALVKKLGLSGMNVWERGADNVWKCKALLPTLPSSQAKVLMDF